MSKRKKTIEELLKEALVSEEQQPYEIPGNWVWTKVGEIANYHNGKGFKSTEWSNKGRPIIRIQDLTGTNKGEPNYFEGQVAEKHEIKEGDLLISWSATLGVYIWNGPEAVLNQHIFKAESFIDKKYHYYAMKRIIASLHNQTHGSGMVHVTKKIFQETPFPLTNIKEQRRIAEKLDRLFNKIEEAKTLIEEAKVTFELRRAAILDKAFRGELTSKWRAENPQKISVLANKIDEISLEDKNMEGDSSIPEKSIPNSWKWVLSNDLFSFVTSGSRGWAKYYDDEGDFFIRVGNLNHQSINIDLTNQQKVSPPKGTEGIRTLVQEGDILISITADIGRIAVVPKEFPTAYINQHVALARPISSYCSEYIAWFLSSRNGGRLQFDRLQRGATKAGLGLSDIKNVWVPIPCLEEQYEIINKIEIIFKKFEVAEENLINTLKTCEELKISILAKAFRGELGTNDPAEESAIELLKEVLQEQVK
ncbi:restriction endonuclease subunit S [Priestia megaterium]|uniref:restriction endonuclease subunit S n=1 Tax=Priestia megaterium TaxID=1404 RepID=UPI003A813E0A